jgi:hypothetical protein
MRTAGGYGGERDGHVFDDAGYGHGRTGTSAFAV